MDNIDLTPLESVGFFYLVHGPSYKFVSFNRFACMNQFDEQLEILVRNALAEDIGDGDHSTLSCISPDSTGQAELKIKEDGLMAGMDVAEKIFRMMQQDISFLRLKKDGEPMLNGEIAFELRARVYTILQCERLVLNCMQRMCGIATLTRKYANQLKGYHTKIRDTRKTTPNFRLLEKEAVRIGGGFNHRFGLYDMIMLKDNHIDFCGGIEKAIEKAYAYVQTHKPGLKIEIETRSIQDVKKVVTTGKGKLFRIMLDNFKPQDIVEALEIIRGEFETEASGGINLDNLQAYAETGVDYVSIGALIHQARSLDLSLKAKIS
jgi:nicotinate-nucleotide pyrophosphorylase (carboxylating)